jgi:hypothetical protein
MQPVVSLGRAAAEADDVAIGVLDVEVFVPHAVPVSGLMIVAPLATHQLAAVHGRHHSVQLPIRFRAGFYMHTVNTCTCVAQMTHSRARGFFEATCCTEWREPNM